MVHNRPSWRSRWVLVRRIALAAVGLLLYAHGLRPFLPVGSSALPGLAGAFLVTIASYAALAGIRARGRHRRPNAETLLVVGLFGLLAALLRYVDPDAASWVPPWVALAVAVASLLVALAGAAYVVRPALFGGPA